MSTAENQTNTQRIVAPARNLLGSLRLPGDKSISHRYALLAAYAGGTTRLRNFSTGADCASSLGCAEDLGAIVTMPESGRYSDSRHWSTARCARRCAGLRQLRLNHAHAGWPSSPGSEAQFTLTGDASLSRRPMERRSQAALADGRRAGPHRRSRTHHRHRRQADGHRLYDARAQRTGEDRCTLRWTAGRQAPPRFVSRSAPAITANSLSGHSAQK